MPLGSSKSTVRICSMILSSSGFDQRCQLRGVWVSPGLATNCECHEVEEERQVGVAAPGLDAPRDHRFEVAGGAAIVHDALRHDGAGIDAELPPLLRDHAAGAGHHRAHVAFHVMWMANGLPSVGEPLVAALGEAGTSPAARSPPAGPASTSRDRRRRRSASGSVGIWSPIEGRSRSAICLADGRVVRLDLALAGVDLEILQPGFHRLEVVVGCTCRWAARRCTRSSPRRGRRPSTRPSCRSAARAPSAHRASGTSACWWFSSTAGSVGSGCA